jgi:hypothetical protein
MSDLSILPKDQNYIRAAGFESSSTAGLVMAGQIDEITGRILVDSPAGGSGTVTTVSVVSANGFAGSVATATTTPAITLRTSITGFLYGNGTAISAATISTGLTATTSTLTANISTGIAGGQTIYGGTAANDDLTIEGTSNATKTTSYVNLQPTGGFVGINTTTPGSRLAFGTTIEEKIRLYDTGTAASSYGIGTTSNCTQIFSGGIGDIAISRGGNAGTQIARWVGATDFMALGTITPTAKLHIDSGNATSSSIKLTAGTTTGLTATDGTNLTITSAGVFEIRQYENQAINVYTNNTLAATFTTGQDLQVVSAGTTATSVVTNAATQTLTNKTLTSPTITTASLSGVQLLAENASIGLDPAGSADGRYTGITVTAISGYSQAFGDLVYLDPTDSRWEACDANSAAGADGDSRGLLGMVVVAGTDGNACTILLNGIIRADAKFPTFTINNPIYVSETAGAVTQTQPVTTDVVIRIVGAALTADEMYFAPQYGWVTHT